MKPYGHSRRDLLSCAFGCCTLKSGKKKDCRKVVDKTNRKTARQDGQADVQEELKEQIIQGSE